MCIRDRFTPTAQPPPPPPRTYQAPSVAPACPHAPPFGGCVWGPHAGGSLPLGKMAWRPYFFPPVGPPCPPLRGGCVLVIAPPAVAGALFIFAFSRCGKAAQPHRRPKIWGLHGGVLGCCSFGTSRHQNSNKPGKPPAHSVTAASPAPRLVAQLAVVQARAGCCSASTRCTRPCLALGGHFGGGGCPLRGLRTPSLHAVACRSVACVERPTQGRY